MQKWFPCHNNFVHFVDKWMRSKFSASFGHVYYLSMIHEQFKSEFLKNVDPSTLQKYINPKKILDSWNHSWTDYYMILEPSNWGNANERMLCIREVVAATYNKVWLQESPKSARCNQWWHWLGSGSYLFTGKKV